jgi:threonine dehydrogenase-like Zn-dependent dehydrogenase
MDSQITKTKQILFHEAFDCRLDTVPLAPLKDDEICCKAIKSVISVGSETISFRRKFDPEMIRTQELGYPAGAGYSMAAEIIEVGKKVVDYKVGDIIFAREQHKQHFNINPAFRVTRMPEGISVDEVCWTTILRAGLFAAMKADIKYGDTVVVLGLGIFGMASLQFARLLGAGKIIAIDPIQQRTDRALKFGATEVITARALNGKFLVRESTARYNLDKEFENPIRDQLINMNNGKLADSAIDATAAAEGLSAACVLTRNGGHVALIADPPNITDQHVGSNILLSYLNVHGIFINMMVENPNEFYPLTIQGVHEAIYEHIRKGEINVKEMITDYVSPADPTTVYQSLYEDRSERLGVLYDWSLID